MTRHTTNLALLALAALLAVAALALVAAADPSDLNNPPTEDWVFDSGKQITLTAKVWEIRYNITVTNASSLRIDGCDWTFNGMDPMEPIWIHADEGTKLAIVDSCEFSSDEDSGGYYIECYGELEITFSELTGLVHNPLSDGGVTVYANTALLQFATLHDNWYGDMFFAKNSQVKITDSDIYNCSAAGVRFWAGDNEFGRDYNLSILFTEIYNTGLNNIAADIVVVQAYTNYGRVNVEVYESKLHDSTDDGFALDVGDHSSSDNGNGSVYARLEKTEIYNIADMGIYYSHLYQVQGGPGQNEFNLTLEECTVYNVTNTGIYVQLYFTYVDANLTIRNSTFYDIALKASGGAGRYGGIFWWYYYSSGASQLNVTNTEFATCKPAIWVWDYAASMLTFTNCTFKENVQDAIYDQLYSQGTQSTIVVDGCTFVDTAGYGIRTDISSQSAGGGCTPIRVVNSTFVRNAQPSLAVTTATYDYSRGPGFNISGCLIADQKQGTLAISVATERPNAGTILHMKDTRINNTGGVYVGFSNSYGSSGQPFVDVIIINSSIENTTGVALNLRAIAYYYGARASLIFENSTVFIASGNGVQMEIGRLYERGSMGGNLDASVTMLNSTIEKTNGIALNMVLSVTGADVQGSRDYYIWNCSFLDAQRGIFSINFGGEMWWSEVKNTLKEDYFQLGKRGVLYYNKFTAITEQEFKAVDGAILEFIYDLDIYVKWSTGAPAVGAIVQIMDNTEKLISVLTVTNHTGALDTFTMTPFMVRETGIFSTTPYVINATFLQVSRTVGIKLDYNKVVTLFLEDNYEPEIYILFPKQGHVQQSTLLEVRGSAWDYQSGIKRVQISLDGVNWINATGTLSWRVLYEVPEAVIEKAGGVFNLRARTLDWADNEALAMVLVRIDPTPPELNIDFPYDGYITNNPELWVRGVTEIGSKVEINSKPVEVFVSMFTYKVTLVEGPNTISVISIDPLGNIELKRMTVTLDTQTPYVILINPTEEGAMTNEAMFMVEAQLEDGLDVTINGHRIVYGAPAYEYWNGVLTYNVSLEPGDNVLVLQARDAADNLLIIERVITFDTTAPWIQVISPSAGAKLARPEVTIIGTVEPTATLLIEGEDVTVQNGYFERTILAVEGRNNIVVNAMDPAGNSYEETLVIFIDTQEPKVMLTAPEEDNMLVTTNMFSINGTVAVQNPQGQTVVTATKILLNGLDYTVIEDARVPIALSEDGTFSISVELMEGRNEFTVTVMDEVGNRATASRTVRLDTHAPTLVAYFDPVNREATVVTSPASTVNIAGYTDPGSVLTIEGILVPVADDGTFLMPFVLNPKNIVTDIDIESVDSAGNVRLIKQSITFVPVEEKDDAESNWGLWFLVISLIILVVVGVVSAYVVRSRRDDWLEMEAARATPMAPIEPLETVSPEAEKLPGPDEIDIKEEKGKEPPTGPAAAPARPRPRPPQQRRAGPARPAPKPAEAPMGDTKELSEKGAEADIGADETDQEGL